MPAIVDVNPLEGDDAISVFESGAILQYLAEKTNKFIPKNIRQKTQVMEWLFWQMGGLGPMAGQNHHFVSYAPEKIDYAIDRYVNETARLYAVLDKQLVDKEFICDEYSIADMACYPWVVLHERQRQNLDDFPNLKLWFERIRERSAVQRPTKKVRRLIPNRWLMKRRKKFFLAKVHTRYDKGDESDSVVRFGD